LALAKKEKIDTEITAEYSQLLAAVQKSQEALLNKNQNEIKNLILDELIKRYHYKEGLYLYYSKNNIEIKKALELFRNPLEINSILKR
jgi:carboxyl-terminal processing protease